MQSPENWVEAHFCFCWMKTAGAFPICSPFVYYGGPRRRFQAELGRGLFVAVSFTKSATEDKLQPAARPPGPVGDAMGMPWGDGFV